MNINEGSATIKELPNDKFEVTVTRYGVIRSGVVESIPKAVRAIEAAWARFHDQMMNGEL